MVYTMGCFMNITTWMLQHVLAVVFGYELVPLTGTTRNQTFQLHEEGWVLWTGWVGSIVSVSRKR